jgi:predicted nucleic acid-binding protein
VERGIRGGAAYDALIGATARSAGALLYTCDLRARATYDLLGVEVEFIG